MMKAHKVWCSRGVLVVITAILVSLLTAAGALASGTPEASEPAEGRPEEVNEVVNPIPEEVLQRIDGLLARCLEMLNGVLEKVPVEARHAIQRAIRMVTRTRERLAGLRVPAKRAGVAGRPDFAYPHDDAPEPPEAEGPKGHRTSVPDYDPEAPLPDAVNLRSGCSAWPPFTVPFGNKPLSPGRFVRE